MEKRHWKFHLLFMLTWNVCKKKCTHVKITLKILCRKKTKHTPSGYSIFASCLFEPIKNKLDCYKGEGGMESFCKDLREHAMKIMNYEKKKKKWPC